MNDIGCKILPSTKIQWISLEILNYTLEVLYTIKICFNAETAYSSKNIISPLPKEF